MAQTLKEKLLDDIRGSVERFEKSYTEAQSEEEKTQKELAHELYHKIMDYEMQDY